ERPSVGRPWRRPPGGGARRWRGRARCAAATAAPAGRARAARRASAPIRRATTRGRRTGAPSAREEAGSRRRREEVAMRSTGLHDTLRRFCLGAFAAWHGTELPFAFEEHGNYGRPTLYEYRPLVRGFIEAHAGALRERDDVRQALDEL